MKKLSITFFLLLSLLAAACSPASADVITALAIEVNPEHLEKTASYARILGYNPDSNTLTVELIAPEVFDEQEVKALRPGDSIFTGGHEVLIQTIEVNERGTYIINRGDDPEQALYLTEDFRGYSMRTFLERFSKSSSRSMTSSSVEGIAFSPDLMLRESIILNS